MDTIVYKVHNCSDYPLLMHSIDVVKNKGYSLIEFDKDPDYTQKKAFKAFINLGIDKIRYINPVVKMRIPSHSDDISVFHFPVENFIKFEFSIPKFYMGNNVVELIPPVGSKYYKPGSFEMIDLCLDYWYKIIRSTIHYLVYSLTAGTQKVKDTDVEVSRLDISFNQIFQNFRHKELYLEAQKNARISKIKEENYIPYKTSITFGTERYYFKIYDKGEQFRKVHSADIKAKADRPDLTKIDKLVQLRAHELQEYADRILRYEMEFKQDAISYIFSYGMKKKHKCYRLYNETAKKLRFLYRDVNWALFLRTKVKTDFKGTVFLYLDGQLFTPADKVQMATYLKAIKLHQTYLEVVTYHKWTKKECKTAYQHIESESVKKHSFFLAVDNKRADFCINTYAYVTDYKKYQGTNYCVVDDFESSEFNQKFSKKLLRNMMYVFLDKFRKFQFAEMPDFTSVKLAVDNKNRKRRFDGKAQMNESSIQSILLLLEKFQTFENIKLKGGFDRKTVYNWKKKYEEILGEKTNFIAEDFVNSIVTNTNEMYMIHYRNILNLTSPLAHFHNVSLLNKFVY